MAEISEWLNICISCGNRVTTHGPELPGQCPACKGWRWLCHLQNPTRKDKPSFAEGYQDTTPEFCPPRNNALATKTLVDKINACPKHSEVKRGRPPVMVPDDLIQQLSSDGMGAVRIAEKLQEMGIVASYKTIQRRLQRDLL